MRICASLLFCFVTAAACAQTAAHPRDSQIHDADTLAWWHTTEALAGDDMEGRDTGSAAYQRAADYVAKRFAAAGLAPAGNGTGYFQTVAMHEVDVDPKGTTVAVVRKDGGRLPLEFLQQVSVAASAELGPVSAEMTFRGYCGKDAMSGVTGKVVVCFGNRRAALPSAAERVANARAAGAAALVNVDDPYFTIEPSRWPDAYVRSVTLAENTRPESAKMRFMPVLRLSAAVFPEVLKGSGQDAAKILAAGGAKEPLPSFEIPAKLEARWTVTQKTIQSPNVIGMLPGTDPVLKDQVVVIAAHLDGYGFGTPVAGDALYNGALDDAAYVALLIQFADDLKSSHAQLKRSILFCAFTGEEKGLLGSNYFVRHPTVPLSRLVADVNLDQLRPLFPLKILTALAIDDTSLGVTAEQVGRSMGIELRADREPERGLLRRADHFPFLNAGVPAIGFVFGFDSGSDAEKRYREWYQVRYHRPQDDLTQPMDFDAAARFDRFFYTLVETVANAAEKPIIYPQSAFAKTKQ